MNSIAIRTHDTGRVLFSGPHPSLGACAEAALSAGCSLAQADLRLADLSHRHLDGADLRGARLDGASCSGANLTGADLTGASARDCDFSHACLAEARLVAVDFTDTSFAGCIVTGARIDACLFSCPTALTLPFTETRQLGTNTWLHDSGLRHNFGAAPIVITGLAQRIIFLDDATLVGHRLSRKTPGATALLRDFLRAHLADTAA